MKNEMWLIWKSATSRQRFKVGILKKENDIFTFNYVNPELNEAINQGFDYFPGFNDLKQEYTSNKLFSSISSRLPNKNRPDYLKILNYYSLTNESNEFEILQASKGRLPTDRFEFVLPFSPNYLEFEVAGIRYSKNFNKCKSFIKVNQEIKLIPEPQNKKDPNAIKVVLQLEEECELGYVPRFYTFELSKLLNKNVAYSAMIKYFNTQSELPDEYITIKVKIILE